MNDSLQKNQAANDLVSVQYTKSPGCIIDMVVTIFPVSCANAYKKALKEVRKDAFLPGFRKGKIPEDLVIKHFNKELKSQFEKELCIFAYNEGTNLISIFPLSPQAIRRLSLKKHTQETGAEVHIKYEVPPTIPSITIDDIHLDVPEIPSISEEEIDEFILRLRLLFATKKAVEDRGVQECDEVVLQVTRPSDNKTIQDRLFCYDKLMPSWLKETVLGMRILDQKETTLPDNLEESTCNITVIEINEPNLTEMTNETLLKTLRLPEDSEIRVVAKNRLLFQAKEAAFERMRKQLRNELIRLYAFDLPQSLVEHETMLRLKNISENPDISQTQLAEEKKSILDDVKRQITCALLAEQFFNTIDTSVSKHEVFNEIMRQEYDTTLYRRNIYPGLTDEQLINRLMNNIAVKRVEEYIIKEKTGIYLPQQELLEPICSTERAIEESTNTEKTENFLSSELVSQT